MQPNEDLDGELENDGAEAETLSRELAPDEDDEFYPVIFAMQRFICDAEAQEGFAKVSDKDLFKRNVDWDRYWFLSRTVDRDLKTSLEAVGSGEAQGSEIEEVLRLLKGHIANTAAQTGDPFIRRSSATFVEVLNREPCHSTLLKMITSAVERKTRTKRETQEARTGPFSDNCGFSKASSEVVAFAKVSDGEERAIYELMQNICDHMKALGKVTIIYKDGSTEDFDGLKTLVGGPKPIQAIEFIDDGKGVNPDNFLASGHFAEEGVRTLGQHGKGMKIACAYLCCVRQLQMAVDAVVDGQEWEGKLVAKHTRHGGPVPLMRIEGEWKAAAPNGKKGTKIRVLHPDEKFLQALEKMPSTFLYANPFYRGAKLVKNLCPPDCEFTEQQTEPGKVECLLGLKKGDKLKYYSALRGTEDDDILTGSYGTVHVDGLDLKIDQYNEKKALLPWALEGFGGDEVQYGRKVKRAHSSVYIEGNGLGYLIPSAVRNCLQRPILKYLIEKAENDKESILEFPTYFHYGKPDFSDQTKGMVLSIFKELHGEAEITLDTELDAAPDLVCIQNTGLFNFLSEAGVPITRRVKEKAKEKKIVKKEREQRVAFALEEEALEKMVEMMARVEESECDLKEYEGKGVLHLSVPGLVGDEEVLNTNDENDLARLLSIAAVVANKKQIPVKIFCTQNGKRVELSAKLVTGDHPNYIVKWEATIEDLDPESQDKDFEEGKTHLLFEGDKINDMYERSVLSPYAPVRVDAEPGATGLDLILKAFQKAFEKVQSKLRKAGRLALKSKPNTDFNPSFYQLSSPACVEEERHSESLWYPGAPYQGALEQEVGPRMERGIDLEESILSPGFYTEQILSRPVLLGGRLSWRNKEFQAEAVDLPTKEPKTWASKIVMRNLHPGYNVLPMRDYDTLLAIEDQAEEAFEILRDASTGSFCILVKPPGLKKLTYYTGTSPKKYPNPPVDSDDQEDVLDYEALDEKLKDEIHAIRKYGNAFYGKKVRAVQRSWGEGFTYDPRREVNDQTRGGTLEEAATRTLNLRRGNCGFAATGAVLYDRAVGIPSQYIAGFEVDTFGMGEGHAKVRFWDGTNWKIREPQTGCTRYEGKSSSSSKTVPVNLKQGLPDAKELVEAGSSLFAALSAYRSKLLAGFLATGLLGWSTYEALQSGVPEAVLSALSEKVNLKGLEPSAVERVREQVKRAVCGDEDKK